MKSLKRASANGILRWGVLFSLIVSCAPPATQAPPAATSAAPALSTATTEPAATEAPAEEPAAEVEAPLPAAASTSQRRIEITPLSVLLIAQGDTATIEATIYDGDTIIPGEVTWEVSGEPAVVDLAPAGNLAKLSATESLGSNMVTATFEDLRQSVAVVIATIRPETRVIDHNLVLYDRIEPGVVHLTRTGETETIEPGNILVSNAVSVERPGLLVKVVSVSVGPDTVKVEVGRASVPEAFGELRAHVLSDPIPVRPALPGGLRTESGIPFDEYCTVEHGSTTEPPFISLVRFSDEPFQFRAEVAGEWDWTGLQYISMTYHLVTDLTLTGPTLTATLGESFSFACEIELEGVPLSYVPSPIPGVGIVAKITPSVGLRGEIRLDGSLTVTTVELSYQAEGAYGVAYDRPTNSWTTIQEHDTEGPQARGPELTSEPLTLQSSLTPFLKGVFGFELNLAGFDAITVDLVEVELGLTGRITVPATALFPPPNNLHGDPTWAVDGDISFALALGVDSPIEDIVGELPAIPSWSIGDTQNIGKTPNFRVAARKLNTGAFEFTVSPAITLTFLEQIVYDGQRVEFWAISADGAFQRESSRRINEAYLNSGGQVTITWTPPLTVSEPFPLLRGINTYDYTATLNHWYRVVITATHGGHAGVLGNLYNPGISGVSICGVTGSEGRACAGGISAVRRPPNVPNVTLKLEISNQNSPNGLPVGNAWVHDLGESIPRVVALVYDPIVGLIGLVYMTDPDGLPLR